MQRQGQVEADGSPALKRQPPTQRRVPAPGPKTGTAHRIAQFLSDVRVELLKVNWPTRSEVANYATVVLVALVILGTLIYFLNVAFGHAINALFGH